MNRHDSGDIVYLTLDRLDALPGLVHAVSTRTGGVSQPPYDSLNLGFHVGDDPGAVLENRKRFAAAVGVSLAAVVATHQVHGTEVRTVGPDDRGTGATARADGSWTCDALVTRERDVLLMGFSADCPMVMLVDAASGVVGLAHAGWRPTFDGIIQKTVLAMTALGAEASRMTVGISPAIGPCCYEVGPDLKEAVPKGLGTIDRFFRPHGKKYLFDLPLFCRERLSSCDVPTENIETAGMCSRCNQERLFSYRGSGGRTGRYAVLIGFAGADHASPR